MNTLYTDSLILRPFRANDAEAMYRNWTYDPRVAKYCRWFPHKSPEETQAYLQICLNAEYCWAITLKENDEPIGVMEKAGMKYVRSCMAQRKFGSDEQCEVRCYEISAE